MLASANADGHADRQQATKHRPARALEVGEQLACLIGRRTLHPDGHGGQHEQHHQCRGYAATHTTQRRHTELAVDEHVVQRDVQQQAENADDHARPWVTQSVAEATQYLIQRHGREAAGDGAQVCHGWIDQGGFDLHQMQHRLRVPHQQCTADADANAHPQGLAHQRADFGVMPGAEALGNVGCGGQGNAADQQVDRHPDRVAQRDGSQVVRTDAAGHHGIDKAHGSAGQLSDHHGQGEGEEGAQFKADPSESKLSGHCEAFQLYTRNALVYAGSLHAGRRQSVGGPSRMCFPQPEPHHAHPCRRKHPAGR